jgi:septum formation protein
MDSLSSAQFLAPARRPRLVLASRSPRRTSLLDAAGLEHTAEHPGFDDAMLRAGSVSPEQWVSSLAYLKAWAKAQELSAHLRAQAACDGSFANPPLPVVVIGADTTCVVREARSGMGSRMVGTPASAAEARAMIRDFMGTSHAVLTGVAIVEIGEQGDARRRHVFSDRAIVTMGTISDDELEAYIASNQWAGKAGAYNLEDRMAAGWPLTCEGDPTTVMGLPMARLAPMLEAMLESPPRSARLPA